MNTTSTNSCHSCINAYSPENLFQNLQGVHKFTFAGVMPSNQGLRLETLNLTFSKGIRFISN